MIGELRSVTEREYKLDAQASGLARCAGRRRNATVDFCLETRSVSEGEVAQPNRGAVACDSNDATLLALAVTICLAMILVGCAKPPPTPTPNQTTTQSGSTDNATSVQVAGDTQTASPLLKRYDQIERYADTTTMELTYHFTDGRKESETTTIQTAFAKPNLLQLAVSSEDNRVTVNGDGASMHARIFDPLTRDFDQQVVRIEAPEKINISSLYKITELLDPLVPNEMLSAFLGAPTGLDMTPLGILLNEGGLVELLKNYPLQSHGDAMLETKEGATDCEVQSASTAEGEYRFWIDKSSGLLRQILFPASVANLPPGIERIVLVARIEQPRTSVTDKELADGETEKTNLQEVSHFVLPPLPLATDLLNKEITTLQFRDADGKKIRAPTGKDQISVLTWFYNHPSNRQVIDQLEAIRQRSKQERVQFFQVYVNPNTDPSMGLKALDNWNISKPPVFDPNAEGLNKLGVKQAPTTVILRGNTLHYYQVGANPNVGNQVAATIERLLAGQNVGEETLLQAQQLVASYKRQLGLAKGVAKDGDGWVEQVEAELPAKSEAKKLKLVPAWTNTEITEPGNLLVVPGKNKLLLVVDGWNQLVSMDGEGNLKRRIPLELPSDAGITLLRAGKGKRDKGLIAAATRGGRRTFVFDFGGKLVMQYPRVADGQALVRDIAFGDLDGDKDPELFVAWQGNFGVHGVALTGKQQWINKVTSGIVSLGIAGPKNKKSVLVAGELGRPYLVDGAGRTEREISLGPVTIHQIAAWPGTARGFDPLVSPDSATLPEKSATYCGISTTPAGDMTAIGIDKNWRGLWEYPLPRGVYRHQIDWPQSIDLPDVGPTWLVPGANGTIHFVAANGQFTDSFATGKHLRGIAGLNSNDKPLIIIATDGELTAYEIEVPK